MSEKFIEPILASTEEFTIEEVTEYAEECGFNLMIYGDAFGLSRGNRMIAIGTLEELVEVLEVSEVFDILVERLSPEGLTIH